MHAAGNFSHEGGEHQVHLDVADDGKPGIIAVLGRLAGFGVDALMIDHGKPGAEGPIEIIEAERVLGTHFGFELILDRFKKALDQAARGRVSRRPVNEADIGAVAGGLEAVGVVDLGVVEVEIARGPVFGQGAQQRVDEDVEALAQIITCIQSIPAVAINERGKVSG